MKTEMKELNLNEMEQVNGGDIQTRLYPFDPSNPLLVPDTVPIKFVPVIAAC